MMPISKFDITAADGQKYVFTGKMTQTKYQGQAETIFLEEVVTD